MIKTPKTDKYLWNISNSLLPEKKYVEFNYAIIDLGGSICLSGTPKCNFCPLKKICSFCKEKRKLVI